MTTFEHDIRDVINRHSRENASNTPDWVLAQYIENCLVAFETATQQREAWYGRNPQPTEPGAPIDLGRPVPHHGSGPDNL